MEYPDIPDEVRPFLKYSRSVATAIVKGESMIGFMKPLFRGILRKYPEISEVLEGLSFDDIERELRPFLTHPEYGVPVRVVIEHGEKWVNWHLDELRREFL